MLPDGRGFNIYAKLDGGEKYIKKLTKTHTHKASSSHHTSMQTGIRRGNKQESHNLHTNSGNLYKMY